MPKSVWKFGKNWVGVNKKGKKKFFKTRKQASTYAGKRPGRKQKAKRKIKRAARKTARRAGFKGSGQVGSKRRAISLNLAKTGAIVGTVALMSGAAGGLSVWQQVKAGNYSDAMNRLYLNFKNNWMAILALNVGVALLGRIAGRFAPKAGVPGAISVKAF